jgi:hypothetical protein
LLPFFRQGCPPLVEQSRPHYPPYHWDRPVVRTFKSQLVFEVVFPKAKTLGQGVETARDETQK